LSNSLRNIKSQFEDLSLKLHALAGLFPNFESEVVNVQRRTVRSLTHKHLKKLRVDIDNELSKAMAGDTGKLVAGMIEDVTTAWTGKSVRSKERTMEEPLWVELTPNGQVSITRKRFSDGLRMSKEQFDACIDTIRSQVDHDPIDVSKPPEEIARVYLVKYCEEERSKLPIFKGAIFKGAE
jgi:hypothetical protein